MSFRIIYFYGCHKVRNDKCIKNVWLVSMPKTYTVWSHNIPIPQAFFSPCAINSLIVLGEKSAFCNMEGDSFRPNYPCNRFYDRTIIFY